jgi:hypothetical protein
MATSFSDQSTEAYHGKFPSDGGIRSSQRYVAIDHRVFYGTYCLFGDPYETFVGVRQRLVTSLDIFSRSVNLGRENHNDNGITLPRSDASGNKLVTPVSPVTLITLLSASSSPATTTVERTTNRYLLSKKQQQPRCRRHYSDHLAL